MRFRTHGQPMPLNGPSRSTRDTTINQNRRLVATFTANHIAEREGDELKVYLVGDADDLAMLSPTNDRATDAQKLRALNDLHRRFYHGKDVA